MKISLNWLSDYIKINKTSTEIADALTMGIAEVEGIEKINNNLSGVVVGQVVKKEKHPNADRLSIAKVDVGNKILNVVCGADNLEQGQKVPVAVIGAQLPNGLKIKKAEIRGVISEGMICSEQELGLKAESQGIMVLDTQAKIGMDFGRHLGLEEDEILEIDNKSLTHRSDLFGHIGIARELAAILNLKINLPNVANIKQKIKKDSLKIKIKNKTLCPRYLAAVLGHIKITDSPEWMQSRLRACGIRPINNIVDITNYVLLEFGQPLHAFDYDKISGDKKEIIVRLAKNKEQINTIDEKPRVLSGSDLVIADGQKAIAIAGIMGGRETQIDQNSKKIILESANFNSFNVRKTAQRLSLRTEALTRFEKGLSPYLAELGINRAIQLLIKYAGAELSGGVYDTQIAKPKEQKLTLDIDKLNQYIGHEIKPEKVKKILQNLNFKVVGSKKFKVTVPLYRMDIGIEEDLIEEVARIYGYGNIKPIDLSGAIKPVEQDRDIYWRNHIENILVGLGMSEVMNYSFYGERLLGKCLLTPRDHIELENPISQELKYLRTSLLPYLFNLVEKNIKNIAEIKIFEMGHVYFEECECQSVSAALLGDNEKIFYQAKGIINILLKKLNIDYQTMALKKEVNCEYFNMYAEGKCLQYKAGEELLGTLALTDQRVVKNFNIKNKEIAFFNLSLNKITELANRDIKYNPLPKYPPVMLDVAFVFDQKIKAQEIEQELIQAGRPLLRSAELFDIYVGKNLGANKKSLAYHLEYRSDDKTLADKEVKNIHQRVVDKILQRFDAKLRD